MANSPECLLVRAAFPNKMYIGTSFCPGETSLRDMYGGLAADVQIRVNDTRSHVANGVSPDEALSTLRGLRHTQRPVLADCLAKIAAGECSAFPLRSNTQ